MRGYLKRRGFFEENAFVLDFLSQGYYAPGRGYIRGPVLQLMGEKYFILLEAEPFENISFGIGERIYIGFKEVNFKIKRITRRLKYDELTGRAKLELPKIIEKIVLDREKEFVDFFNKSQPLTPRMHSLELFRGIGKKTLWKILNERRKKPFENFKDIEERGKIANVAKTISERILREIIDEREKYHIFTR